MLGDEERRLSRMNNTSQGGATEGNATDDALMVDQGLPAHLDNRFVSLLFCRGKASSCDHNLWGG
jgi:hypothetical protein